MQGNNLQEKQQLTDDALHDEDQQKMKTHSDKINVIAGAATQSILSSEDVNRNKLYREKSKMMGGG